MEVCFEISDVFRRHNVLIWEPQNNRLTLLKAALGRGQVSERLRGQLSNFLAETTGHTRNKPLNQIDSGHLLWTQFLLLTPNSAQHLPLPLCSLSHPRCVFKCLHNEVLSIKSLIFKMFLLNEAMHHLFLRLSLAFLAQF